MGEIQERCHILAKPEWFRLVENSPQAQQILCNPRMAFHGFGGHHARFSGKWKAGHTTLGQGGPPQMDDKMAEVPGN